MGFEFVRFLVPEFQVADTVVTRTRLEYVAEGKCGKGGEAARAAAAHDGTLSIRKPLLHQIACAIDGIVDVNDTPLSPQPIPIFAPVAGAATVVDFQHGKTAAGVKLHADVQRVFYRAGRPAVRDDDQGRQFTCGRFKFRVVRRMIKAMGLEAIFGWVGDVRAGRNIRLWDRMLDRTCQAGIFTTDQVQHKQCTRCA